MSLGAGGRNCGPRFDFERAYSTAEPSPHSLGEQQ
jgi:hypothetical protein